MKKRKFKVGKILGITGGILLVVIILFSYFFIGKPVAEGILGSNQGNDTKTNSIKDLEKWNFDVEGFRNQYSGNSLTLMAEDGNEVPVTTYTPDGVSKGSVILVHGHGGDHMHVAPLTKMYLNNQYNVYAIDQRSSGDSKNPYVSFGYFEKLDIKAVVDYINDLGESKIILHGQSMGAASSALYAETAHGKDHLSGLILDSSYDNMKHMFLGVVGLDGFIGEYFSLFGDLYLRINYGFGFGNVDIEKSAKNIETKTLVIQSAKDDIAPISVGETIFENIKTEDKTYWLVDSKHIKGLIDYPQVYEEKTMDFIGE